MNVSSELLFFFSALGAFNGIALGLYILIIAGRKHIANIFLGMVLLLLSVRAGKSVFFYFSDFKLAQHFVQAGLIACSLIGPFLYFFVFTVQQQKHEPPAWKYHLAIWLSIIIAATITFPYYQHHDLWSSYFVNAIYLQWLVYIILSLRLIALHTNHSRKQGIKLKPPMKWAMHVTIGITLVAFAFFTGGYTSYIVGAITFTILSYFLILFLINTKKKQHFLLRNNSQRRTSIAVDGHAILAELNNLCLTTHVYKQTDVKSADIAKLLGVPNYKLSQAINDQKGMNFNAYINTYRVEAAKKMLRENPELTIDAIGEECGFKSKSSFYSAFKKETGTTPSKFV